MNTGAEAVETAIKAARRWGYKVKQIPENKAEIIVCKNNFHGRTITIISFSSEEEYKKGFGPFTKGFKMIEYNDATELKSVITSNTVAFLVEPIQGEAGIVVPDEGYIKETFEICKEKNVLFIADEIQTGLGRTGKMFACDWDGVIPDMYILGKALGGGVLPISAVAANEEILNVFDPGSHGSTFGGNPLACAVAIAALKVLQEENLIQNSLELGKFFKKELENIAAKSDVIKDVRGKGLFIGIELNTNARPYCEKLAKEGILSKETHENIIRFAPPLNIKKEEIVLILEKVKKVF